MEVAALRVRDYPGLLRQLDRRRQELNMRMEDLDHRSGVQPGYSAKLLVGLRRFGEMSLPCILGALECDLVVVPRPDAAPIEHAGSCAQAERTERRALPVTGEM
jgi:hypothetical protein